MTDPSWKPLTAAELADLVAKAKAATPGPWQNHPLGTQSCVYVKAPTRDVIIAEKISDPNAAHIAAANPETILRLAATVREMEGKVETLREALKLALPMVRGYAAERRVPINDEIVNSTEVILAATAPQPADATAERGKENGQ